MLLSNKAYMVTALVLILQCFTLLEHSRCFIQHASFTHRYSDECIREQLVVSMLHED